MSVVPYYNKPTQAGIEAHFRAIAGSTALPVIVHDNPGRCAQGMTDETLLRLSEQRCVVGLRDGTGSAARPLRLRTRLPADFQMLSGDDANALAYLVHGGDGMISAVANVAPGLTHDMIQACRRRDVEHATAVVDRLAPLCSALAQDAASIKYALGLCGLCSPQVRLPMVALPGDQKAAITQAMAAVLGP
jgi:4-hydroxy-tetrahydrodipicolinate synthase